MSHRGSFLCGGGRTCLSRSERLLPYTVEDLAEDAAALIARCWDADPLLRPSMREVVQAETTAARG